MRRSLLLAALALLGAAPAPAQAPAPRPDADSVRALASRDRARGPEHAPVTILAFSDFQCPFCRQWEQSTLAPLDSVYLQTGKAKLVFYNLPLPNHPHAWGAAEAALCAGAQGRFWSMHDRLFALQAEWGREPRPLDHFQRYAAELGLDAGAFLACVTEDLVAPVLIQDLMMAARSGISGTPFFALVREPREGEAPQDAQRLLSGAQPFEKFQQAIEELLGEEGTGEGR